MNQTKETIFKDKTPIDLWVFIFRYSEKDGKHSFEMKKECNKFMLDELSNVYKETVFLFPRTFKVDEVNVDLTMNGFVATKVFTDKPADESMDEIKNTLIDAVKVIVESKRDKFLEEINTVLESLASIK